MQRLGLVLASLGLVRIGAISFTRFKSSTDDGENSLIRRIIGRLPSIREGTKTP